MKLPTNIKYGDEDNIDKTSHVDEINHIDVIHDVDSIQHSKRQSFFTHEYHSVHIIKCVQFHPLSFNSSIS
jgi:hypothetical protein